MSLPRQLWIILDVCSVRISSRHLSLGRLSLSNGFFGGRDVLDVALRSLLTLLSLEQRQNAACE